MPQEQLSWSTIGLLDSGKAGATIDHAIQVAVVDIDDRGHEDEKPRKVVIQLTMTKAGNGVVHTTVECQTKLPVYRTHDTAGRCRVDPKSGVKVMFQPHAPENPDQETLDFDEEGEMK